MSRYIIAAVAGTLLAVSSMGPATGQFVPHIPTMPVIPTTVPMPAVTPIRGTISVQPFPQPPPPLDLTRGIGSTLTTTTTPNLDLRGTLGNTSSAPTVNTSRDDGNSATPFRASQSVSTSADPAVEVRQAQDRGVALHPGGGPPPKDKDKDDDEKEGNKWWLWVLLVIGVLVVNSWRNRGK